MMIDHQKEKLADPAAVAVFVRSALLIEDAIDRDKEHFWSIGVTCKNQVKMFDLVAVGGLTSASTTPREIFRRAIIAGVSGIIVAHNHPSGDPSPSIEDKALTRRLIKAGELLGIVVQDHVIVITGDARYMSFLEQGLITPKGGEENGNQG